MSVTNHPQWQSFVDQFNQIAVHHHRYEVFRDFVTISAIALHNAIMRDERLEREYMQIVAKYKKDEMKLFCSLLGKLVILLDVEPCDVLGALYMALNLGNTHMGQFFTPPEISEMMARLNFGDMLAAEIPDFITLGEPTCGAGGMVLAFVKLMIENGHNPAQKLWVQCQDIDRIAALMCYLQITLWNIPGAVIVGNTLTGEVGEVFYTPQHYRGRWKYRLTRRERGEAARDLMVAAIPATENTNQIPAPN